jgi:hypothetical protein
VSVFGGLGAGGKEISLEGAPGSSKKECKRRERLAHHSPLAIHLSLGGEPEEGSGLCSLWACPRAVSVNIEKYQGLDKPMFAGITRHKKS